MQTHDIYILIFLSFLGFILNKKIKDDDVGVAVNTILFCFILGYLTCLGLNLIFK